MFLRKVWELVVSMAAQVELRQLPCYSWLLQFQHHRLVEHQSLQKQESPPQILITPFYGGWVCWIDFMLHIVEIPSKRPYPDRSGSILVELSNRLYDSFENPSPRSELEICVNHPDRDLDLGTKIGDDPRQGMAKGDRGKQMRRICFRCIKKSKIQKCSE